MRERQREGSRKAVQQNGRTRSVSHQEIELRHAASDSSFQAYAESGNLHLGAVIRNGLRNPGGWESATPDAGAVRHDNVVMIEAVTPRTHRGGKERATTPEAHQRTNAARWYAGAVTRRTKHRAGRHRLENTPGVRSDPRNIGARQRNEERATTRTRERR